LDRTGVCNFLSAYDAHITRRANWVNHKGPRISGAEWRAYVRTDNQIKRDPKNTANDFLIELPGEEVFMVYDPAPRTRKSASPRPPLRFPSGLPHDSRAPPRYFFGALAGLRGEYEQGESHDGCSSC
jgi:hypothetical protein